MNQRHLPAVVPADGPEARLPESRPATALARDRLLAAAYQLLTEVPVDRITVRMIAARAGVGHSLITRHFGTRAGLLTAAIGATLVNIAKDITEAPDIYTAVRRAFDRVLQSPELTAAINVVTTQSKAVEQREGFPIVEAFAAQLEAAGAPPQRARARAATITNMIFVWISAEPRWLRMGGHPDATTGRYDYLQTVLELVDNAIAGRPAQDH
jgi:AcrR family transcriptional regulator